MGKSDMLAIRSPQLLALFVVTLGCSAFSVVQEAAWMEETGGNACGLKENSCPGSAFSGTHAACSIALEFKESCDVVQAEMKARIAATNGWIDRKSHPGTYKQLEDATTCLKAQRTTGAGAKPGPFTDKFGFIFTPSSDGGCAVQGCSESQVSSLMDMSTNFCNQFNLFCGADDGCKHSKHELHYSKLTYGSSCKHGGTEEHNHAKCTR